jgi:DNA-binding NarL/FixJ family response regulator
MLETSIRIGIVDDHTAFRQALTAILAQESSLSIVLEAENGEELIRKLESQELDVLILDIKMPILNGVETLAIIYEVHPEIKVLVLSAFMDEVFIAQCLKYSIYGYLSKAMDIREIIKAITQAYNNEIYLTNLIGNQLIKKYLISFHRETNDLLPDFSNEDIRILNLLKEEKTTGEISEISN